MMMMIALLSLTVSLASGHSALLLYLHTDKVSLQPAAPLHKQLNAILIQHASICASSAFPNNVALLAVIDN